MQENESIPPVIIELGFFTWSNTNNPMQKGWSLYQDYRTKIAEGIIKYFYLALKDDVIQANGGVGGIEVILNSRETGFRIHNQSFPWYWDKDTNKGGWINYDDLLQESFVTLNSGKIYIQYDITTHPYYEVFKTDMALAEWGQLSIQYGLGMKDFPVVDGYLTDSSGLKL
jgi:hypothetical protein